MTDPYLCSILIWRSSPSRSTYSRHLMQAQTVVHLGMDDSRWIWGAAGRCKWYSRYRRRVVLECRRLIGRPRLFWKRGYRHRCSCPTRNAKLTLSRPVTPSNPRAIWSAANPRSATLHSPATRRRGKQNHSWSCMSKSRKHHIKCNVSTANASPLSKVKVASVTTSTRSMSRSRIEWESWAPRLLKRTVICSIKGKSIGWVVRCGRIGSKGNLKRSSSW